MASIALASSDAALLSDVTRGLSNAHEIHWLPLPDALTRCERGLIDALIVDLESGRPDVDALRSCVLKNRVPVIVVARGARGEPVARNLGGVFFSWPSDERGEPGGIPEAVWSLVLLDAMRMARRNAGSGTTVGECAPSATRGTILVVDDDEPIRSSLRDLLETEGYTVDVAGDGDEALTKLRSGYSPGLILLYLTMPRTSGWEVRAVLREDPRLSRIPVAVISAAQPPAKGLADWYLKKPIDLHELLRVIDGFLAAS